MSEKKIVNNVRWNWNLKFETLKIENKIELY